MEVDDFVVHASDSGHLIEEEDKVADISAHFNEHSVSAVREIGDLASKAADIATHFNECSVGVVREIGDLASVVYVIGQKANYLLRNDALTIINPLLTGKEHSHKICNICHCLKNHDAFERNQNDGQGRPTSRPSCRICRRSIDQNPMTAAEKRRAERHRPERGTLFRCPICRKETIAGVTANIVLDHRHGDGASRTFICDSCNTGLGRFKNGQNYLKNAIAYIESFER